MEAAFDAYFRAADLDRDGRISGQEAVAFFKGSGLPQPVLAQIWTYADKNRSGFLGREDFFNALKLVTVAQSGRELTPDIVRSALFGPAAAKIPAPRINVSTAAPQASSVANLPNATQAPGPVQQTPVVRGTQGLPGISSNPQVRPPQPPNANTAPPAHGQGVASRPPVGSGPTGINHTSSTTPSLATDWFSGKRSASPLGATSQTPTRGISPQANLSSAGISVQNSAPVPGYNSHTPEQGSPFPPNVPNNLLSSTPPASAAGHHHPPKPMQAGPVQSISSLSPHTSQLPHNQPPPRQQQFNATPSAPGPVSSNIPTGQIPSSPSQPQAPWPKITQVDVRKYMIVFIKVDRDRDGKITGEEARNLFLSWRLPRDVLRKVWDLSDQDKDGMLSFKEFCIAVYLMERHREHRPLPDTVTDAIWAEGTALPSTGQFAENPSAPAPQASAGYTSRTMQGPHHGMLPSSMKPPSRRPLPLDADDTIKPEQQKPKVPVLEEHLVGQLSKEEQDTLDAKFNEASVADKKVQELEKEILDSREKTEFYRTKMQELILYKSRCDNRFNEVSESMSADKREVQSLSAKYDERCKKVGDVASKLTMDEATFREIQEKKLEIYNAIVKLQKGDDSDEKFQERANKIQSDLEELVKSLNEQCKRYGLRAKPTTLVELPFGWQPGIQETAYAWDEEWDNFGDEGFSIIKELTVEVEPPVVAKSQPTEDVKASSNGASTEKEDNKGDKSAAAVEQVVKPETAPSNIKPESAKSPPVSPVKNKEDGPDEHDKKQSGTNDVSPRESISNRGAMDSPTHGDKTHDGHSWGMDNDSLWNFDHKVGLCLLFLTLCHTVMLFSYCTIWHLPLWLVSQEGENGDSDLFFGPQGLPPIRTGGSSSGNSVVKEQKPFFDSVPGTPVEKSVFDSIPGTPFQKSVFDSIPGTPVQKSVFDYSVPSTPMQNSVFDYSVPSTPMQKSLFDSVPGTPVQRSVFDSVPSTPMQRSVFDSVPSTPTQKPFFDSFPSTPMQRSLFDSGPSRAESPTASSMYGKEQKGFFDSSVPSTPMYNSSFTPRYSEAGDDSFDTMSQYSSFGMHESNSFGQRDSLSRFDSFSSNADNGGNDTFARFDSMKSSNYNSRGYSFDDEDPFGTGPFKSTETTSHSPTKHGTDTWSAF
uniref:Calcium-binding EF hand family protein n=1 Tax=Zea mays TaxID=4577 RepID=A0A804PDS2_MAIZE